MGRIVPLDYQGPIRKGEYLIAITFDDGFRSVVENAIPFLIEKGIPSTIFIPSGHIGKRQSWIKDPLHENYHETVINAETIKCLPKNLIKIGSHCVTHTKLTKITHEEACSELQKSKKDLEEIIEEKVDLLAFPYGDYNETIIESSRDVGYEKVFAGDPVWRGSRDKDFLQGRIDVTPKDRPFEFFLKCRGAYQWLPLGISFKRKIRLMFYSWRHQ